MTPNTKSSSGEPQKIDGLPRPPSAKFDERRKAFAKNDPLRVVFVSAPKAEAENLARKLLEERLVACANLTPDMHSLYWWKGKITSGTETLIVMKTTASKINDLMRRVRALHSYAVPEILTLPILESNPAYAEWVAKEIGSAM